MKVKVLRDKCIGCGTCVTVAPKSFKLDKENLSVFIDKGDDDGVLLAAQSCPMEAIKINRVKSKILLLAAMGILGVVLWRSWIGGGIEMIDKESKFVINSEGKVRVVEIVDLAGEESVKAERARQMLLEKYGEELSWEIRQAPLVINKQSMSLAELAVGAMEQDKFWEFKERLADDYGLWSKVSDPEQLWRRYAEEMGIVLQSNGWKAEVLEDLEWVELQGIDRLPMYLVNGELMGLGDLNLAVIEEMNRS